MSDPKGSPPQKEAAAWFGRLSRVSVSTDTLRAFQRWQRVTVNAEAYRQVGHVWEGAAGLRSDFDIRAATEKVLAGSDRADRNRRVAARAMLGGAILAGIAAVTCTRLDILDPCYSTRLGQQRLVVLSDGSRIHLNTDSRLRVHYSAGQRDITLLRGEAFFDVAHAPARPFVVHVDHAQVRALGTRFDVRSDASAVQVTLLQGRVQVSDRSNATADLVPDETLSITKHGLSSPEPADAATTASWTTGRLIFRAVPLQTAVAEVNRYTHHKIVLDSSAAPLLVSGVFNIGDTEAFVAAVTTLFNMKATPTGDGGAQLTPTARSYVRDRIAG